MFGDLTIFRHSSLMAQHALARQKLISSNIANVDTPNYILKEMDDFSDFIEKFNFKNIQDVTQRNSPGDFSGNVKEVSTFYERKPSGNLVSVEREVLKSVEVERQHSKALTIYQHSIDILKMSIGRGR